MPNRQLERKLPKFQKHNQSLIGQKSHLLCFPLPILLANNRRANFKYRTTIVRITYAVKTKLKRHFDCAPWPNYYIYERQNDSANLVVIYSKCVIAIYGIHLMKSSAAIGRINI